MALDGASSGTVITVATTEELKAAYATISATSAGGTILLDPSGGPYSIGLSNAEGASHVTITSADPDQQAHVGIINLNNVDNVTIDNIRVDSSHVTDRVEWLNDLNVKSCANIEIINSTFQSTADSFLADESDIARTLGGSQYSDNFVFANNFVAGYHHALFASETNGVIIHNNDISQIQGDGLRLAGVQNVEITDNYIHDFLGTDQHITHGDLIQFWGANAKSLTENVLIQNNILDSGNGAGTQTIFIRNEEFGVLDGELGGYLKNFKITDNLIYNGATNGIRVADIDGLEISNNTVLWNPEATYSWSGGEPVSNPPKILVTHSLNETLTDNIAAGVSASDSAVMSGNNIIDYKNPDSESFVDKHFVNVLEGGEGDIRELWLLPDSAWNGTGSSLSVFPDASDDGLTAVMTRSFDSFDRHELQLDAGLSLDLGGYAEDGEYQFVWSFADGEVLEGVNVTRTYDGASDDTVTLQIKLDGKVLDEITRNFSVGSKDILEIDFEDGAVNLSENDDVQIVVTGSNTEDSGADGKGFLIGDGNKLEIHKSTDDIHNLKIFGLSFDMQTTGDERSGTFLSFQHVMSGKVTADGSVKFTFNTDVDSYTMTSDVPVFDDGNWHRIGIGYNGETGQLEMFADGARVAETAAFGETAGRSYYNMIFGNTFSDSIDARIDNVEMSLDPSIAGDLSDVPAHSIPLPSSPSTEVLEPVEQGDLASSVEEILTGADDTAQVVETTEEPVVQEPEATPDPVVLPEEQIVEFDQEADLIDVIDPLNLPVDPIVEIDPVIEDVTQIDDVPDEAPRAEPSNPIGQFFSALGDFLSNFFQAIFGGGNDRVDPEVQGDLQHVFDNGDGSDAGGLSLTDDEIDSLWLDQPIEEIDDGSNIHMIDNYFLDVA